MDPDSETPHPLLARPAEPTTSADPELRAPRARRERPALASDAGPEDALAEIREHLGAGRYRTAQRLTKAATARFPDHPAILTMNRALNEPASSTRSADGVPRHEEFEWLRNPPAPVRGKWVALVGSDMVTSADTLDEVMKTLGSLHLDKPALVHHLSE